MIRTYRVKDGSLRYAVRVGHGPERTFNRKADAEEYEATQKRNRRRGKAGLEAAKPNIRYRKLVQLWKDNFAPSDWRLDMVAYSEKRWGNVYLSDMQPELIGSWLANLTGKTGQPLSDKTKAHILETMRQVLNAGVEWGYITKSPARPRAFKAPSKKSRVHPIQPFESWDDVLRVADACAALNPIAGPFVRFVCATGLRCPGEVMTLLWTDIDRRNKIVKVGSKTNAGHRTVPLSVNALAALDDLPRSLSGYVFPGKRPGKPFDYANWRDTDWRTALDTCGLPHRTPYEMRHTFATLALAEGASIDDVATVMGHEDITVAYDYYRKWIKAMADRLRLTLDKIGADDDVQRGSHGDEQARQQP